MGESSTRLRLRVLPGGGRAELVGRHGEAWKLRVAAPPERGRANEQALDLLATTLALPRAHVRLIAGHGSRDKVVELVGLEQAEAERRLARRHTSRSES
jgi:uncharacterized protein YggU (UPF0235/DUF167 family)